MRQKLTVFVFFFFNDTATTEIYTLSLHDALPIFAEVSLPFEPEPPLFIQQSYSEFDSARINAETEVERATSEAHEMLIESAGRAYPALVELIQSYELVVDQDDNAAASTALSAIYEMLQSDTITGSAANTISKAEGYRSEVETTLGRDYRRFASLLPAYLEHPTIVIREDRKSVA